MSSLKSNKSDESQTRDESIESLLNVYRNNGLVLREVNKNNQFVCDICLRCFQSIQKAVEHIRSDGHKKCESEQCFDDIDKHFLLEINYESTNRFRALRMRRQLIKGLNELSNEFKLSLIRHGIRIKDGFGAHCYQCIECRKSFAETEQVIKHLSEFEKFDFNSIKASNCGKNENKKRKFVTFDENVSQIENIVSQTPIGDNKRALNMKRNISSPIGSMTSNKSINFSPKSLKTESLDPKSGQQNGVNCELCLKPFSSIEQMMEHMKSVEHRNKRSDDIDKQFLTEMSDKTDPKVMENRRKELNKYLNDSQFKLNLIEHGIRLKDGVGAQAYVCVKCELSFEHSYQMVKHFYETLNPMPSPKKLKTANTLEPHILNKLYLEGIVVKVKFYRNHFLCRLCEVWMNSIEKTETHIESKEHSESKTFKGIDRLIVAQNNRNDQNSDRLMAQKRTLKTIDINIKEDLFLSQGIKVDEGFGANTYVCTKCDTRFESIKPIKKHLKEFHKSTYDLMNSKQWEELAKIQVQTLEDQSNTEDIKNFLITEGIDWVMKKLSPNTMSSDSDRDLFVYEYICQFCCAKFDHRFAALVHLHRPFHKKIKSGDYLTPIEAAFLIKTERINELEVCLARMQVLYRLDTITKYEFKDKGIRLKDGIGSEAFVCIKCETIIGGETVDLGIALISEHILSPEHNCP